MTVQLPEESTDWIAAGNIDLLHDLAAQVKTRFMPLVFTCSCGGAEESCRKALDDPRVWERREAIEQIAKWLLAKANEIEDSREHKTWMETEER